MNTEGRRSICCGATVAVVGGAGFLGSHLVNHLIDGLACNVLVIDNLVTGRREFVHRDAAFEHHDITQSENYLRKIFNQYQIEYVFNYAAEPYIPVSFDRPLHVFATNATGALHVINAAQESDHCKGILQVSSAEIYGFNPSFGGISEEHPVSPRSSYGAAKAAIDSMVQVRHRESGTPCMALRQFNCLGERETHPYIVPELIHQFKHEYKNRGHLLLGNDSERDFMYAGDAVAMAVELLERGEFGQVYNLGSEKSVKIHDLAFQIGELFGYGGKLIPIVKDPGRVRPWEIWHLRSDNTKIHNAIPYRPKTDLHSALRKTLEWYFSRGCRWPWER